MDTLLVRLKPHDPRRGHVLRRFTYAGIKFHEERGWYRVTKPIGEYLRAVRQVAEDEYAPPAFDVCTEEEAKALDAREDNESRVRRIAADEIKLSEARTEAVTTADLSPRPSSGSAPNDNKPRKDR
jgi:hypothetical protein